ncbi:MAG: AMP-binding protein [Bacillota bacterium]|nr:AMP-binding protein [Bacillota bacterium]
MIHRPLYNVRPIKDLKDMIEQSGKLYADKDAFLIKAKNDNCRHIKYSEFKSDIDALGTALLDLGLKNGFIAVIGENRYEWCVTYLAAVCGTGVAVPLDKELPQHEIENLLTRSNAGAVVFSGKLLKEIESIAANESSVKYFINMDADEDDERFLSFRKLVDKGRELISKGNRSFIDFQVDSEGMNILLFTSGTTDLAKGVMLSHKNICSDMMAVCSSIHIDNNDSVLSILPLHHTYECTAGFLAMIYNGCRISFCEGLKHIAKNLKETQPTILILVPLILENMYKKIWEQASKHKGNKTKLRVAMFASNLLYKLFKVDIRKKLFKAIHDNIGGRVRLIISGAAAIDPKVSKGFRTFGIMLAQGYGLTECAPIAAVNREKIFRDDSIGQPLPGMQIIIDNPDADGIGELLVKGDNVMLGYYQNQQATEKVLKDGWLHTGDLGKVLEDDFFIITGRKKNVIVTKNGKNIFPEEVEAYLSKSPYILESLVYGKTIDGEDEVVVCAQIVPDFDAIREKFKQDITAEEIHKLISQEVKVVNRSMPLYKRVREFNIRENEFVKTTTKKIKRYLILKG